MAIWSPYSEISWRDHLKVNPYVEDVTRETRGVQNKISQQTKDLVASNQALTRSFGEGFDSVNETLTWGIGNISSTISEVENSIHLFTANFDYNMGLVIAMLESQNALTQDLLQKLDAIHQTLKSPLLTQARELYHIGCERLKRGLLDKAVEAFHQAEDKNDTDFFTQYQLGNLYLYGINQECNVVDIIKARKHFLNAARYANAETSEPRFTVFTAQSFFHASIACYALSKVNQEGLIEACDYAERARKLAPPFEEAIYHLAKFCAAMNQPERSINFLQEIIELNGTYAVKALEDSAFDNIRNRVIKLLTNLKEKYKKLAEDCITHTEELTADVMKWPENDDSSEMAKATCRLAQMKGCYAVGSFLDYADVLYIDTQLGQDLRYIRAIRREVLKQKFSRLLKIDRQAAIISKHRDNVEICQKIDTLTTIIDTPPNLDSREGISDAVRALKIYDELDEILRKEKKEEEEKERIIKENERLRKEKKERKERIYKTAFRFALTSALIFWPIGYVVSCVGGFWNTHTIGSIGVAKAPIEPTHLGLVFGAVIGFIIGLIVALIEEKK